MMVGDQTHPSKTLQEPVCCSCSMRPNTVVEKDDTWGQHSSSLVLNKGIELRHALHIWRETLIVLSRFTASLRTYNWQMRCVAIDEHIRNIAQHICAKLNLILTVVLISRPIGPWKNSPLIIIIIIIIIIIALGDCCLVEAEGLSIQWSRRSV